MPCLLKVRNAVRLMCVIFWATAMNAQTFAPHNVTWTTPGKNAQDSMPIGNGDLAANVWTEQNGAIMLLVAKSGAWTETGKLVNWSAEFRLHASYKTVVEGRVEEGKLVTLKVTPASRKTDVLLALDPRSRWRAQKTKASSARDEAFVFCAMTRKNYVV